MKDLKTITEWQLLHYAKQHICRRIAILKDELKRGTPRISLEKTESDVKRYTEQLNEIDNRILELIQ